MTTRQSDDLSMRLGEHRMTGPRVRSTRARGPRGADGSPSVRARHGSPRTVYTVPISPDLVRGDTATLIVAVVYSHLL